MEEGFQKAQTDNLPTITEEMIMQFFNANQQHFFSAEVRGVKAQRSARESYGDNAVGYVQLKRSGSLCTVKGRVTPEHKLKEKAYYATLVSDENSETVISLTCEGCAASASGCKHTIAFLFWVHRKCSLPSPTEVECYWKKSKLASVGTSKFIHASELGTKKIKELPPKDPSLLKKCFEIVNAKKIRNLQLCNYFSEISESEKASLHFQMLKFATEGISKESDDFVELLKINIRSDLCLKIAEETLGQNKNSLWHNLRYGRITASKLYEAARCSTLNGSLVETILGAKFRPTEAIRRGINLENDVINAVKKNHNFKIKPSGLLLNNEHPIFGASPDGVAEDFIIEVKCPVSEKSMSRYFINDMPAEKHFAQMQLQMLFANKPRGLFCVAHPNFEKSGDITEVWIERDNEYCLNLMKKALQFWKEAIFPKILKSCLSK